MKTTEQVLENKKNELNQIRKEVLRLEDQVMRSTVGSIVRKSKGTYWTYRNSYSCPDKPSDYWKTYSYVYRVNANLTQYVFQFQTDKYGEISIKPNREYGLAYPIGESTGYRKISKKEFDTELKKVRAKLARRYS